VHQELKNKTEEEIRDRDEYQQTAKDQEENKCMMQHWSMLIYSF
jgi:hypothetical protein